MASLRYLGNQVLISRLFGAIRISFNNLSSVIRIFFFNLYMLHRIDLKLFTCDGTLRYTTSCITRISRTIITPMLRGGAATRSVSCFCAYPARRCTNGPRTKTSPSLVNYKKWVSCEGVICNIFILVTLADSKIISTF